MNRSQCMRYNCKLLLSGFLKLKIKFQTKLAVITIPLESGKENGANHGDPCRTAEKMSFQFNFQTKPDMNVWSTMLLDSTFGV